MKKNVYRIYDNTLLRFIDDNQVDAFCNVKDEIQLDSIQYLENFLAVINSTVWNSGINKDKINKTWNTLALFRPEIEIIKMQDIIEAYERMLKSDVRYRFVIDMASLKKL